MTAQLIADAPSDLYITGELAQRALRNADYQQEKQALQELAARMLDNPGDVLPHFVELAMEITDGVSAGLSLYEPEPAPGVFRWQYLIGSLAPFNGATTPRNYSPCGITLDRNAPVLTRHPERFYRWISDANIVVPEVLLVPLYMGGTEPLGTLWIVGGEQGHFDQGHARIAAELASFVGIALKMIKTEKDLQAALAHQETLTKEMSHRVKNLFAVAEGMVRIGLRTSETKEELASTLVGRFHALAGAHDLIRRSIHSGQQGPRISDFAALVGTVVRPHERSDAAHPRFRINGPALALGEGAINGMALIFHELATNSLKYGAVSADDGQVEIQWTAEGDDLKLEWKEMGGPKLDPGRPAEGFGSKLLADTITRQFRGSLNQDWRAEGLNVTLQIPIARLGA